FVRYTVTGKQNVSSTCSIFTLKPAGATTIDTERLFGERGVTSVQVKQPQLQIARAYTVLPRVPDQASDELRFLIRKERNGEVSGYLHRLALDSYVEIRGPTVEYGLPANIGDVLFLAGGTGIAPALQVAEKLKGESVVHILWASRRSEDCRGAVSDTVSGKAGSVWNSFWRNPTVVPSKETNHDETSPIIKQLGSIKRGCSQGRLQVDYFVDEESTFISPSLVESTLGRIHNEHPGYQRLIFVSGPEGFVNHWAGPKQWVGGREVQGPLGGLLRTMDLGDWQVVKL
ncbi:hypothetical protein BAUCODRAFT_59271, partial [Baudoinia panamericana UAMH 10762]